MADCLKIIDEVSAGRLNDDELEELITELQDVQNSRTVRDGLDNVESAMLRKGQVIAEETELAAMIEKRNRLKNILVEQNLTRLVNAADEATGNPSLGLEAALVGVNAPFDGAQRSVDSLTNGLRNEYAGGLIADLRRANLLTQFDNMKGDFELEVARVMYALNTPDGIAPRVSKDAQEIGKLMHKYQRASIDRLNREGGYVRRKSGYVTRQSHRPDRMAKAGEETWVRTIKPLLDFDKMDVPAKKIDGFLSSAYKAIESGIRLNQEVTDLQRAFKGPGNIAKKDAASRVLEFKSADAWFEYDRQFGMASLRESFMQDITRASRNTALMINFGTNPKAMLERVAKQQSQKFRGDKKKLDPFKTVGAAGFGNRLDNMMDEVTGDVNLTSRHGVAQVSAAFRAWQNMAKLGGAWIATWSDQAFMASSRVYNGRNIMEAWGDAFAAPFEGLKGGDKRVLADLMGAGLEGQLGNWASRWNPTDVATGRVAKAQSLFFKLNLMGPWTDANKRGITMIISRDLAMNASKPFNGLPPDMQRMLNVYGLDAKQWEVARLAVQDSPDGRSYLMPGDVANVRGNVFTGLSSAQQDKLRDDVKSNLFALLSSEADFAVPTPGARERAIMRQGYRPGTFAGEAIRFVGQFKSFGVTALTKVLGRQIYGTGSKKVTDIFRRGMGANIGLANAIVMSTVMGFFVMQAKELSKGRETRDPLSPKTWTAAALQGGGLGIYGDFLFGEANRFGGGPLTTALGPSFQTADDAIKMYQTARAGEDVGAQALRLTKSNIPFANLFYAKGAMDYLLWYQLQEAINPGYLRRMERRIKRENDQEFWLPPSKVVQTGGGFR